MWKRDQAPHLRSAAFPSLPPWESALRHFRQFFSRPPSWDPRLLYIVISGNDDVNSKPQQRSRKSIEMRSRRRLSCGPSPEGEWIMGKGARAGWIAVAIVLTA